MWICIGNYLTTGHSENLDGEGEVKFWDLRNLTDDRFLPIFTSAYKSPVVTTRFYYIPQGSADTKFVLTAFRDKC